MRKGELPKAFRVFQPRVQAGAALALLLAFLTLSAPPAGAAHKALLVLVPAVGLQDLLQASTPNLDRLLAERGAIGLLNTRTAGGYTAENGYLTLGAGARGATSPLALLALDAEEAPPSDGTGTGSPKGAETGAVLFARHTGISAPPGSVVVPGIAGIVADTQALDQEVVPGLLGEALRRQGKKVAVVGNADGGGVLARPAALVAMDARGLISMGEVSPALLRPAPLRPYGVSTDYGRLAAEVQRWLEVCDLVVVDPGDTLRLENYARWLSPGMESLQRRQALEELDAFLGRFLPALARGELRLFLASPLPTGKAIERNATLTFFVLAGEGVTPGVLTSPTTRRWGIVTNTDVAPSILEWLGIEPPLEMTGRPVRTLAAEGAVERLKGLEQIFTELNAERPVVLKSYVALQILVILLSIPVFLLTPRIPARFTRGLQLAILALTTVPLAFLFLSPLFSPALTLNLAALLALVILLTLLAFLAARYWRTHLAAFFLIYAATTGLLLADGLTGSHLIQRSFLGYDPIGGARFYGVGNEYMGALIGAAIMSATLGAELWPNLQRHATAVTVGLGGLVALLLASPQLGANVGGTIAAVTGFTWTAMALRRRRVDWRWPLAGGFLLLALLGLATLYDATLAQGATSHLGRTWELIQGKGVQELWLIAVRKLKMNMKLMRYTIWSRALVAFIASGIVLCYRPVGLLRKVMRRHTFLTAGLWGCLAGGVAAFVANDSGVVAASTLMLYPAAVFLHLILAHLVEKPA